MPETHTAFPGALSHYDRLALSADGRLDPAAVAAALAADAAERRALKPRVRVPAGRAPARPSELIRGMAAALIAGAERLGGVGARWLTEHGFSEAEIAAHGDAAVAEAARRRPDLTASGVPS